MKPTQDSRLNIFQNFWVILSIVSILMFLILYSFAGKASFWFDEVFTVYSIQNKFSLSDFYDFYIGDSNAPLYYFITYFWYRLVPHTEQALLSLSIIFTILAAMVIGAIGKKLSDKRLGFFAFMFFLCNSTVIYLAAYEFRVYSLVLLVTALNMYFYLLRLQEENWKNILLYGITMCLMPYTHYITVLFCFGMFLADCVLIFWKRAKVRVIASYFIGALLFLPWFILKLSTLGELSSFWAETPTLYSLLRFTVFWLSGTWSFYSLTFWLAALGFVLIAKDIYIERKSCETSKLFMAAGYLASAFMVLISYIYCKYINSGGSFFVERYFFPVIIFFALSVAYGADFIFKAAGFMNMQKIILILFTMIIFMETFYRAYKSETGEPYRETAAIIQAHEQNSSNNNSIILTTDPPQVIHGWQELYFTQPTPQVLPLGEHDTLSKLQSGDYDTIYLCCFHVYPFERYATPELLNFLQEDYNFLKDIGGYRFHSFQVLTHKK